MSFTTHEKLEKLPEGTMDWDSSLNLNSDKREAGRHLYLYAGETVSSLHVVYLETTSGYMMKADDPKDHIGVCPTAVVSGEQGQVRYLGVIEHDGWTWDVGPVYVSSDTPGDLTQTQPSSYSIPVAFAYSATGIFLSKALYGKQCMDLLTMVDSNFQVEHNADGTHKLATRVGTFVLNTSNFMQVGNTIVKAGGTVVFTATNTTAAARQAGASPIYVSDILADVGFNVRTATGSDFGGNETYNYHYFD